MNFKVVIGNVNDAALFVKICGEFDEDIDYKVGRYILDGKSLMGVLSAGLNNIATVKINTKNKRTEEKFKEKISLWLVEGE